MPPSAKRHGKWQGWQRRQRDDLTLSEVGHALWERRMVVVGCMLLFLAVALFYVFSQESVYTAETTLSVRLDEGTGAAENFDEILSGLRNSGATRGLVEEASDRAEWEAGPLDFDERLSWEPVNKKEVKVRFSAPTPEEAARGANAYADVFVERLNELRGRLAGGTVAVDAEVEEPAEPPEDSTDPRMLVALISACIGGLLVGGVVALFRESRARRWSGSRDAEVTLRAPVLGVIPDYSNDFSDGVFSREGSER